MIWWRSVSWICLFFCFFSGHSRLGTWFWSCLEQNRRDRKKEEIRKVLLSRYDKSVKKQIGVVYKELPLGEKRRKPPENLWETSLVEIQRSVCFCFFRSGVLSLVHITLEEKKPTVRVRVKISDETMETQVSLPQDGVLWDEITGCCEATLGNSCSSYTK